MYSFCAALPPSLPLSLSLSLSVARRREYLITFYKHNWRALQSMLHLFSFSAAAAAAATHVRHINNAVIISALRTHTNTTAQTISLLVFHTEKNKGQHDWAHTYSHTHTHSHSHTFCTVYVVRQTYRILLRTSCGSGGRGRCRQTTTMPATIIDVTTTTPIATTAASISSVDCLSAGPLPMLAPAPTPDELLMLLMPEPPLPP